MRERKSESIRVQLLKLFVILAYLTIGIIVRHLVVAKC
jgi:hypothetical protein